MPIRSQEKALPAEAVAAAARAVGIPAQSARQHRGGAGRWSAQLDLEPPPRILITGSLYLAGEVLAANGTLPE